MALGSQLKMCSLVAATALLSFACSEPQPATNREPPAKSDVSKPLTLRFEAGGTMEFAGERVTLEQLKQRLAMLTANGQRIVIQIEIDRAAEHGYVGRTMEMLSQFPNVTAGVVGGT
ncbi:MAG TPA: biopolymer transporter ExbD [Hyphomonadaceae bacterium]|nr:biopolymer transporter ExbD [Hyphomonadaceae bacterium]